MSQLMISNSLIVEKMFSFLDLATAKQLRLVSSSCSSVNYLKHISDQDNTFLKLRDSDEESAEEENRRILNWARVTKPEHEWILKQIKIPIQEAIRSDVIQFFLRRQGRKITHLKLFRKTCNSYCGHDTRQVLLDPPQTIICILLNSLCPNIEFLSIVDLSFSVQVTHVFPKLNDTKLKYFELSGTALTDQIPFDLTPEFIIQLIWNSPKLEELKLDFNYGHVGDGVFDFLKGFPSFVSNIETLQLRQDVNFKYFNHLTNQRFPKLQKLVIESSRLETDNLFKGFFFNVNTNIKVVALRHFKYFEPYVVILLSYFPSVETLILENIQRFYHKMFYEYEAGFTALTTLILKCEEDATLFTPIFLLDMSKMMPMVEKIEISGLESLNDFTAIAKGIQGWISLKELDLGLGPNYKNWIRKEELDKFPDFLRISIHE